MEAAVVGLPSEDFGELPAAGIVVKANSKLTAEEVKEHVASMNYSSVVAFDMSDRL